MKEVNDHVIRIRGKGLASARHVSVGSLMWDIEQDISFGHSYKKVIYQLVWHEGRSGRSGTSPARSLNPAPLLTTTSKSYLVDRLSRDRLEWFLKFCTDNINLFVDALHLDRVPFIDSNCDLTGWHTFLDNLQSGAYTIEPFTPTIEFARAPRRRNFFIKDSIEQCAASCAECGVYIPNTEAFRTPTAQYICCFCMARCGEQALQMIERFKQQDKDLVEEYEEKVFLEAL